MNNQHSRPLWIGLVACALLPVLLLSTLLMFSAERVFIPVVVVALISLGGSLVGTFGIALPYVLWLRRKGKLNAVRICIAGALVGAIILAVFNFQNHYYPQMNDQGLARWIAISSAKAGALPGATLGFLSALALCLGAGITMRPSRRSKPRGLA